MKIKILIIICAICGTARADLIATVLPGITFPVDGSVPVSYANLNLLGEPTITISGTIGGTNTLTPGSVTTLAFSSSVYDNVTIGLNGGSPPSLQTLGAGIAGWGLQPTNTTQLMLLADPAFFILSTNSLGVTNYINAGNGATNTTGNSGSTTAVWVTLKTNSLTDINITPGGISSQSINTNGLAANRLAMALILTNNFPGENVTNTSTNFNTVFVGNTNGVGQLAVFSTQGFIFTNLPVIATNIVGTTTNTFTNYPPTFIIQTIPAPTVVAEVECQGNGTGLTPLTLGGFNLNVSNIIVNTFSGGVPHSATMNFSNQLGSTNYVVEIFSYTNSIFPTYPQTWTWPESTYLSGPSATNAFGSFSWTFTAAQWFTIYVLK